MGMRRVIITPWIKAISATSPPLKRVIIGRVVSAVVAPPIHIASSGIRFERIGYTVNIMISLNIFTANPRRPKYLSIVKRYAVRPRAVFDYL